MRTFSRTLGAVLSALTLGAGTAGANPVAPSPAPAAPEFGPRLPARAPKAMAAPKSIDWKKEIVYFLLVDRFADGNPKNNGKPSKPRPDFSHLKEYQGGDLEGVIAKLDYIKGLGVTALWLSPVMDNADEDFIGWWPYHGYHPVDHYKVENRFGTMKTMKRLVDEAHKRGLRVILDMVYNQVGPQHPWVRDPKLWEGKGFKHWFHPHSGKDDSTSIKDWQNQEELETKELFGLPDLRQSNPNVYDHLLDVSRFWVNETGADGFRLDAVKHVSPEFWKRINADLSKLYGKDFLMLGEVFEGDPAYVARYQKDGFNALFDIPLYYAIVNSFAAGNSMEVLSDALAKARQHYSPDILWSTIIDNHDVTRFSHKAGNNVAEKTKLALDFISSLNGIPVLYYGTEVWLEGGADRDDNGKSTDYLNRRMMAWDRVEGESQSGGIIHHIRKLFAARRAKRSLHDGQFVELYKDPCVFVFAKVAPTDVTFAAFNNCNKPQKVSFPVRYGLVKDGEELVDLLGDARATPEGGEMKLNLDSLQAYLFNRDVAGRTLPADFEPLVTAAAGADGDFVPVKFIWKPEASQKPATVFLAGPFNGWNPKKDALTFNQGAGQWEITYPLRKGRHPYKFVLDGTTWIADPKATETENDNFGGRNSIMVVK